MKNVLEIVNGVISKPVESLFTPDNENILACVKDALASLLRARRWKEMIKSGVCSFHSTENTNKIIQAIHYNDDFFNICKDYNIYISENEKVIESGFMNLEGVYSSDNFEITFYHDVIHINKSPIGNFKLYYMYQTCIVVYDGDDYSEKTEVEKDKDIPVFDEKLFEASFKFFYKKMLNEPYADEYDYYQQQIKNVFNND